MCLPPQSVRLTVVVAFLPCCLLVVVISFCDIRISCLLVRWHFFSTRCLPPPLLSFQCRFDVVSPWILDVCACFSVLTRRFDHYTSCALFFSVLPFVVILFFFCVVDGTTFCICTRILHRYSVLALILYACISDVTIIRAVVTFVRIVVVDLFVAFFVRRNVIYFCSNA